MTSVLKLWCIVASFTLSECVKNELSCYQCKVSDDVACTDEYLLPCPNKQVYDRCETRERRTADGRRWVEKGCALSPCHLLPEEEASLGLLCDYSAPAYDCVVCCKESGCNGATMATPAVSSVLVMLLTALLVVSLMSPGS